MAELSTLGPVIKTAYEGEDNAAYLRTTLGDTFDPDDDAGDYSATPFTVASSSNIHRFFTGAQNHIIEFPAGLSTDPAAYGSFTAPVANTLSLRRVAGSGVSINGVAADGTVVWTVPPGGTVYWQVRAANTIRLWGDARPVLMQEQAEPASPAAGLVALYVDSADGVLKVKKSNGTVVSLEVQ